MVGPPARRREAGAGQGRRRVRGSPGDNGATALVKDVGQVVTYANEAGLVAAVLDEVVRPGGGATGGTVGAGVTSDACVAQVEAVPLVCPPAVAAVAGLDAVALRKEGETADGVAPEVTGRATGTPVLVVVVGEALDVLGGLDVVDPGVDVRPLHVGEVFSDTLVAPARLAVRRLETVAPPDETAIAADTPAKSATGQPVDTPATRPHGEVCPAARPPGDPLRRRVGRRVRDVALAAPLLGLGPVLDRP